MMVVFFLMVGLEIKREVIDGHLSTCPRRVFPGSTALGGMIGPALIFLVFNMGDGGNTKGWGTNSPFVRRSCVPDRTTITAKAKP